MPKPRPRQLPYPVSGLNEDGGYDIQVPLTTNSVTNCRSHDTFKGRVRGGSRPGLSKFHEDQINGADPIQSMIKVVRPVSYEGLGEHILVGTSNHATLKEIQHVDDDGDVVFSMAWADVVTVVAWVEEDDEYIFGGDAHSISGVDGGGINSVWRVDNGDPMSGSNPPVWYFYTGSHSPSGSSVHDLIYDEVNDRVYVVGIRRADWDGGSTEACIWALNAATGALVWAQDLGDDSWSVDYNYALNEVVAITATTQSSWEGATKPANIFVLNADDGSIEHAFNTGSAHPSQWEAVRTRQSDGRIITAHRASNSAWEGWSSGTANTFILDKDLTLLATHLHTVGSAGEWPNVAWIDWAGDYIYGWSDITAGSNTVQRYNSAGVAQWAGAFVVGSQFILDSVNGRVYVRGVNNASWTGAGGSAGQWILAGSDGSVISSNANDATLADTVPFGMRVHLKELNILSTREAPLIIVAGGTVKKLFNGTLTTPTGGTDVLVRQPYQVNMAALYQIAYAVDGTNEVRYNLTTDTVDDWSDAVTNGSLPLLPRLIARWRGRIVLSGIVLDPANWFMSAVGNPLDWDYSPTVTVETQAVAGNASETGEVGDVVTALIPMGDDTLIIGGDQSIWAMSGDPASGGYLDLVTDAIGMAWNAWTIGPAGEVYFLGIDGVYLMPKGELPRKLTQNRLDERFKAIDHTQVRALLAWDFLRQGLIITLATVGFRSQVSYFYDIRTDSWTVDSYSTLMGPSALYAYDSEQTDDVTMLVGCKDGYLRQVDPAASDDDGTSIASTVRLSPVALGDGDTEGVLTGVNVTLADGSGAATLKLYMGQTAEECATSAAARITRTLSEGRNAFATQGLRGRFCQLELTSTARWALENVFITTVPSGLTGVHTR